MKASLKGSKRLLKIEGVVDIFLFGSAAKGKVNPGDIDIAILIDKTADKKTIRSEARKTIGNKADIQTLTVDDYDKMIWLTMMKEGISVKHGKPLAKIFNTKPVVLYKYSLKELTPSKKVMFERAIKKISGINKLSNRVVLVPMGKSAEFDQFLETWNLDIDTERYELLPLLRKVED